MEEEYKTLRFLWEVRRKYSLNTAKRMGSGCVVF